MLNENIVISSNSRDNSTRLKEEKKEDRCIISET